MEGRDKILNGKTNIIKKLIMLALLLFTFVPFVFSNPDSLTLEFGQAQEFNGYSIKLQNLKEDKVVISVNGESAIFQVGDEKTLSNVVIKLNEISYLSQEDGNIKIDARALNVCGDNKCDATESQAVCCKDCGCQTGYDCIDNKCAVHVDDECNSDEDCDDSNKDTLDICAKGKPRKCTHISSVVCKDSVDCDDENPCTTDVCKNNDCFNEKIPDCASGKEGETINVDIEENKTGKNLVAEPILKSEEKVSFIKRILNFFRKLFGR